MRPDRIYTSQLALNAPIRGFKGSHSIYRYFATRNTMTSAIFAHASRCYRWPSHKFINTFGWNLETWSTIQALGLVVHCFLLSARLNRSRDSGSPGQRNCSVNLQTREGLRAGELPVFFEAYIITNSLLRTLHRSKIIPSRHLDISFG